jgi:hypothetical protein
MRPSAGSQRTMPRGAGQEVQHQLHVGLAAVGHGAIGQSAIARGVGQRQAVAVQQLVHLLDQRPALGAEKPRRAGLRG